MPVPVDPFPDFTAGSVADPNQVDARFLALYEAFADLGEVYSAILRRTDNTLNIPNQVPTGVSFPDEAGDTPAGNQFDPLAPTVLTCRRNGLYSVHCWVAWAPNGVGHREMRINGVELDSRGAVAVASHGTFCNGSRLMRLLVGQTVEMTGYQTSGDTLGIYSAELAWARVGP